MSDDYESLPDSVPFVNHLAAGALAGIMEHSLMYPIDNIKTRIQASININQSIINSIKKVSSAEGLKSLWKGISAVVVGAGPAHAVYFGVYEFFKTNMIDNHASAPGSFNSIDFLYFSKIALAGGTATATSEALMNPFDTIKQRMQINSSFTKNSKQFNPNYTSIFKTMSYIYKKEGFKAFYYSYPTTLLMTVPFHATNFLVYESMTKLLNPTDSYNPLVHCVSGGLAGGLASAITTPFDCVKTVLQTHSFTMKFEDASPSSTNHSSSSSSSSTSSSSPTSSNIRNNANTKIAQQMVHSNSHEGTTLVMASRNLHQSSASHAMNASTKINSFFTAAKYIYSTNGINGFTKGLKARVVSNIPATAISWTSYEMAKFYLNRKSMTRNNNVLA